MLNRLLQLLERFRSDERGAFLVIFGVMAIVLVATSGAVVDFTSIEQARTRAQVALDSAALGLQPRIYNKPAPTEEQLRVLAQNLLRERMIANDINWNICAASGASTLPCVRVDSAEIDIVEGSLVLEASMELPMAFVSLVGMESMRASLLSEATRKRLNIEVAMVLDNSGSMAQSNRMGHLKEAANCAVNVLLKGACEPGPASPDIDNVTIGIVPFTEFVNVGTANKTASWMDRKGVSDIANDNFDSDDRDNNTFAGPVDRFALYDQMDVAWKGCVEARKPPYDTSDDLPNASSPSTLFVPALAPDEPDTVVCSWRGCTAKYPNNYLNDKPAACKPEPKWVWTQTKLSCNKDATGSKSNYDSAKCTGSTTDLYEQVMPNGVVTETTPTRPASLYYNTDPGAENYVDVYTSTGGGSKRTNKRIRTWTYPYSERELQERMCKYDGATTSFSHGDGPNVDCPGAAVLPLTNSVPTIKSRIGSMKADGGTNIHQGVMWGFHMLSPTEPLTEGKAYDSATSKVMIVMTDGENTHAASRNMNGSYWYVAYGYPYNERLGERGDSTAELQVIMDTRTITTCTNAKLAGITIYTIGLSAPNQKTKDMLTACASSPGNAHFPTDPSQLKGVFSDIADELSNLRLAR